MNLNSNWKIEDDVVGGIFAPYYEDMYAHHQKPNSFLDKINSTEYFEIRKENDYVKNYRKLSSKEKVIIGSVSGIIASIGIPIFFTPVAPVGLIFIATGSFVGWACSTSISASKQNDAIRGIGVDRTVRLGSNKREIDERIEKVGTSPFSCFWGCVGSSNGEKDEIEILRRESDRLYYVKLKHIASVDVKVIKV
ncbi:MAG: hypothetical protein H0T62_12505 [Parachlamydiaceae bacterium]|nr:hypothetical protein [Parachlamydiaceae bacterium]